MTHYMRPGKSRDGAEGRALAKEAKQDAEKRFEIRVAAAHARYLAEKEANRAAADQYGIIRKEGG